MLASSSKRLLTQLVAPSKVASALDWKKFGGSILSLDIHKERIGLAIASHPSYEEDATTLEPIRFYFRGGKIPDDAKRRLERIVKENQICGVVVSWPLQRDTGHMGAACGRTIHVLEDLLENSTAFSEPIRPPICFWDSEHSYPSNEDQWGRCAEYNRTSSKETHLASKEQYNQDENIVAAKVWDDFVKIHWPTIHDRHGGGLYPNTRRRPPKSNFSDHDDCQDQHIGTG